MKKRISDDRLTIGLSKRVSEHARRLSWILTHATITSDHRIIPNERHAAALKAARMHKVHTLQAHGNAKRNFKMRRARGIRQVRRRVDDGRRARRARPEYPRAAWGNACAARRCRHAPVFSLPKVAFQNTNESPLRCQNVRE